MSSAIARKKKDDRFELVNVHRRKHTCELVGLKAMPIIVRDLTDDQATIIICDSNLQHKNVLPSEKAYAYKMKMDALKRQGKRASLTSTPVARKSSGKETAEII